MLEGRLLINDDDKNEIENLLEENGYDFDWDSGDRLMIDLDEESDIVNLLEQEGYNVDII